MKRQLKFRTLLFSLLIFSSALTAQSLIRKGGMVMRGTHWQQNGDNVIRVDNGDATVSIDGFGGGAWLTFFSRMNDRTLMEFSLGAVGQVDVETKWVGEEVNVSGMTPVLLGARYELFPKYRSLPIQVYIQGGGGPYWVSQIHVREYPGEEEAVIQSKLFAGLYAGAGFDFMVCSWFGLNLDTRYHMVGFNPGNDHSGFEMGVGLCFKWGRYQFE